MSTFRQMEQASLLPKVFSTAVLFIFGYYVLNRYSHSQASIQHSFYEVAIYLIPSQAIYLLQAIAQRYSTNFDEMRMLKRSHRGNRRAKAEAVRNLAQSTPLPNVIRRARYSYPTQPGPPGLGNEDSSCYQNSTLQSLASLPAFRQYLDESSRLARRLHVPAPIHDAMARFLDILSDTTKLQGYYWTPPSLKIMDSVEQQDAQEYFFELVNKLEMEDQGSTQRSRTVSRSGLESPAHASPIEGSSLLGRLSLDSESTSEGNTESSPSTSDPSKNGKKFLTPNSSVSNDDEKFLESLPCTPLSGKTGQKLECHTCRSSEGLSTTPFTCLTLNLGQRGPCSLEDLIDDFTATEDIEGVECTVCTKAQAGNAQEADDDGPSPTKRPKPTPVKRTKGKQTTITCLPKDLVININRSIFDSYGDQLKNRSGVKFPARLPFISKWCPYLEDDTANATPVYELKCVVTHHGHHHDGHYVAWAKRDKNWYCFNDTYVDLEDEDSVLKQSHVFMLYYELVDPLATTPEPQSTESDEVLQSIEFEPLEATTTGRGDDYFDHELSRTSSGAKSPIDLTQSSDTPDVCSEPDVAGARSSPIQIDSSPPSHTLPESYSQATELMDEDDNYFFDPEDSLAKEIMTADDQADHLYSMRASDFDMRWSLAPPSESHPVATQDAIVASDQSHGGSGSKAALVFMEAADVVGDHKDCDAEPEMVSMSTEARTAQPDHCSRGPVSKPSSVNTDATTARSEPSSHDSGSVSTKATTVQSDHTTGGSGSESDSSVEKKPASPPMPVQQMPVMRTASRGRSATLSPAPDVSSQVYAR